MAQIDKLKERSSKLQELLKASDKPHRQRDLGKQLKRVQRRLAPLKKAEAEALAKKQEAEAKAAEAREAEEARKAAEAEKAASEAAAAEETPSEEAPAEEGSSE